MTFAGAIFLIVVGAILRYATSFDVAGVDEATVGLILIIAGVVGLVLALLEFSVWSRRRTVVVEDDRPGPGYRTY